MAATPPMIPEKDHPSEIFHYFVYVHERAVTCGHWQVPGEGVKKQIPAFGRQTL